jgi:hypothetical protein
MSCLVLALTIVSRFSRPAPKLLMATTRNNRLSEIIGRLSLLDGGVVVGARLSCASQKNNGSSEILDGVLARSLGR